MEKESGEMQGSTYREAGVDIEAGELFASMIAEAVTEAWPDVRLGGFADGGKIPARAMEFKGGVDGVGTKIDLARRVNMLDAVGADAVAMAAVDVYMSGARPAAFYDYLVVDRLEPDRHIEIIWGMIAACQQAMCYLGGGETAEHPGVGLPRGYIDIGGFCVGFPDPLLQLNPKRDIRPDMRLWGWLSGGLGSNGFSLARRVLKLRDDKPSRIRARLERNYPRVGVLAEALLAPTVIHIKSIEAQRLAGVKFIGHAHITGGGLVGNIPRILPDNCVASIFLDAWDRPPIFGLIQDQEEWISEEEMRRVFNLGLQVVSVTPADVVVSHPACRLIGRIRARRQEGRAVEFLDRSDH